MTLSVRPGWKERGMGEGWLGSGRDARKAATYAKFPLLAKPGALGFMCPITFNFHKPGSVIVPERLSKPSLCFIT